MKQAFTRLHRIHFVGSHGLPQAGRFVVLDFALIKAQMKDQGDSQQYHRVSTLLVRDMPRMRKSMQSGLQSGSLREELYSESPQPACVARPGTRAVDNQSIHPKVQAS